MANDAAASHALPLESLVQDSLRESWEAFKQDAVLYILANLVVIAVSIVSLGILIAPLTVGMIDIIRKRRRGEAAAVGDVFSGFSSFGSSFVAGLIMVLGTLVGLVLLVLPGLVFAFLCAFTFHAIAYRGLGAVDAVKHSVEAVKANALAVAVMMLVALIINAIGGMVWVGNLLTGPFTMLLFTVAYEKLSAKPDALTAG
jgi:uncharacterized membrane protein